MNEYYVYILQCADGSFYTGICNNLERRMTEHHEGGDQNCYTFGRRPLELVYYETFSDVNEALLREKQIKGWTRVKKKALIEGRFERLIALAKKTMLRHPSTSSG